MASDREPNLINATEAAKLMGVSRGTLHRWNNQNLGPNCYTLPNNTLRYRPEDVEDWMRARYKRQSTSQ